MKSGQICVWRPLNGAFPRCPEGILRLIADSGIYRDDGSAALGAWRRALYASIG
ncbi:MAG: hypothetical protein SGJ07_10885 [Rhodospirillaceae bacterium]|nr:hypothetical protein [Rhodospirillaceae bacterium]